MAKSPYESLDEEAGVATAAPTNYGALDQEADTTHQGIISEAGSFVKRFGQQLWNMGIAQPVHALAEDPEENHLMMAAHSAIPEVTKGQKLPSDVLNGVYDDIKQQLLLPPEQREVDVLKKYRQYKPGQPPPLAVEPTQTGAPTLDMIADTGAGVTSFVGQIGLLGKMLPAGTPTPFIWEIQNLATGGKPGRGAALAALYGSTGGLGERLAAEIPGAGAVSKVARGLVRPAPTAVAFEEQARLAGATPTERAIQAAIPYGFEAAGAAGRTLRPRPVEITPPEDIVRRKLPEQFISGLTPDEMRAVIRQSELSNAEAMRYDRLLTRAEGGDRKAWTVLNRLVQGLERPTYEQLLERARMGDRSATLAIQKGFYKGEIRGGVTGTSVPLQPDIEPLSEEKPLTYVERIQQGLVRAKENPTINTVIGQSEPSVTENPSHIQEAVHDTSNGSFVPKTPSRFSDFHDYFSGRLPAAWQGFRGWLGGLRGETMPLTTRANQPTGELGARYISSRIAAPFLARDIAGKILETGADPLKVGAVLTEDNLTSVRQGFVQEGNLEAAGRVKTLIGKEGYFKTPEEYQAALNDPLVQETITRFKEMFSPVMDELYKKAQDIAPEEVLPTRGLQTDARINLKAVTSDEPAKRTDRATGMDSVSLTATFKRPSPFARPAKGTAQQYDINLNNIIENTYGRQLEIANYKDFINSMVQNKLAIIGRPGETGVTIDGRRTVPFPIQRKTLIISKDGKVTTIPRAENLFVRTDLAREFRSAVNVDAPVRGKAIQFTNRLLNTAAISGLTDATAHTVNLNTALLTRPGVGGGALREAIASTGGIGDLSVASYNMIKKALDMYRGTPETQQQLAELARIGALRTTVRPFGLLGRWLVRWDRTTRLVMDDGFKFLAGKGLVENTETARREFVNQVGQYNRRAQGTIMKTLKDSGVSPFIVAGKTFANLGVKNVTLDPGAPATNIQSAVLLRGLVATRWAGTVGTIMLCNYLFTHDKGGGIMGRPGTPLLNIDTGRDTKEGRPFVVPVGDWFGYTRALRITGLRGVIEDLRKGLTPKQAVEDGLTDIANSLISIGAGPPVRFGVGALTGYAPRLKTGRLYPVVPPGESQLFSDFLHATAQTNPITGGIMDATKPQEAVGKVWAFIQRQMPGVVPRAGGAPEVAERLPEIVTAAQTNAFIDDVARRARKLPADQQVDFINQQIASAPPELQEKIKNKLKRQGALRRW